MSKIETDVQDDAPAILYRNGDEYTQAAASSEVVPRPEPGFYNLAVDENGIRLIADSKFNYTFPKKIYGNVAEDGDNILRTWSNRVKNTGVILSGPQGTGKSLTAQYVISKAIKDFKAVVIEFSKPILDKRAFKFIQNLDCPVVIFIDEFEKKYNREAQEENLGYMDGSSLEGVLWILTVNVRGRVCDYYTHRPSRVYFHFKFDNVDMETVSRIVDEKFDVKGYISKQKEKMSNDDITELKKDIVKSISTFTIRTFDTILSFIDEINTTGYRPEKVLKYLNIEIHQRNRELARTYFRFIAVGLDKKEEDVTSEYDYRSIQRFLRFNDVFGDSTSGNKTKPNDFTEIPLRPMNKAYPEVLDFKMDKETNVDVDDYDMLKFTVGKTTSGKDVFIEFSKKPFPVDASVANDNEAGSLTDAAATVTDIGVF